MPWYYLQHSNRKTQHNVILNAIYLRDDVLFFSSFIQMFYNAYWEINRKDVRNYVFGVLYAINICHPTCI